MTLTMQEREFGTGNFLVTGDIQLLWHHAIYAVCV
jgi:hypothetical protein